MFSYNEAMSQYISVSTLPRWNVVNQFFAFTTKLMVQLFNTELVHIFSPLLVLLVLQLFRSFSNSTLRACSYGKKLSRCDAKFLTCEISDYCRTAHAQTMHMNDFGS
jgi:hypothetical protein